MQTIRLIFSAALLLTLSGCVELIVGGPNTSPVHPMNLNMVSAERSAVLPAKKKTIQGYDVLGVARYCKKFLAAPKLPAVSTLLNTFGDPLPCIKRRLEQGGLSLVQIDIRDATCFRNKVCPPGTPPLDDWRTMRIGAKQVNQLALAFPGTEFQISPWLEHDIKDVKMLRKGFAVVKKACPTCGLINSPVSGAKLPEIPLELHGTKVSAYSVSGDGASIFDGDNMSSDGNGFQHRVSGDYSTYAWFNSLNLRCTGEDSFTPPLLRTNRPTSDEFEQAYAVMQPEQEKPAPPAQCKQVRDIEHGTEINKPNAEAYCNGQQNESDARGNKPLLIIKLSGKAGEARSVLNSVGKVVGCLKYYGPYSELPGAYRWYMGNCSGQTPIELMKQLGNEWGFLSIGQGKCIRFNSIRRQGTYR